MTLHVLHVHSGNIFGGVERLLLDLVASDRACTHDIALCWPGETADRLRSAGARVTLLNPVRIARPWTVAAARRTLARELGRRDPAVAVVHSDWSATAFGTTLRRTHVPWVRWHHSPPGHRGLRWLARRVPPTAELANSAYTAGAVSPIHPPPVIHPPVRALPVTATRSRTREAMDTPPDALVVLIAARLEPWKGHVPLLEAMGNQRGHWQLWIAGGPQSVRERGYAASLASRAGRLGISAHVRFLGQRRDIGDLLAAADIYCQPNLRPEPFGIAIVEALYASLPVVAAEAGGPLEIVTPDCGVLVPPGDVRALADTLAALMESAGRRVALGSAGPARAATLCDPDRQVVRIGALLRDAAGATLSV